MKKQLNELPLFALFMAKSWAKAADIADPRSTARTRVTALVHEQHSTATFSSYSILHTLEGALQLSCAKDEIKKALTP